MKTPPLTEQNWRALARSAPWRWTSLVLEISRRELNGSLFEATVGLRRHGGVRIESTDGPVHRDPAQGSALDPESASDTGSALSISLFGWSDDGTPWDAEEIRSAARAHQSLARRRPADLDVPRDEHGLILARPASQYADFGTPFWYDYQSVAMLDPVELADQSYGAGGPDGQTMTGTDPVIDIHSLHETRRYGRRTWWAQVTPTADYHPICSCCPLLFGEVSEAVEAAGGGGTLRQHDPGMTYATAYLVGLDALTGICVSVDHLDGTHAGTRFSLRILQVDTLEDDSFLEPTERIWRKG